MVRYVCRSSPIQHCHLQQQFNQTSSCLQPGGKALQSAPVSMPELADTAWSLSSDPSDEQLLAALSGGRAAGNEFHIQELAHTA